MIRANVEKRTCRAESRGDGRAIVENLPEGVMG
jgi:hypothetical protein